MNSSQNYTSSYLSWQPPPSSIVNNVIIEKIIISVLIAFVLFSFMVGVVHFLCHFIAGRGLSFCPRADPASARGGNRENRMPNFV